MLVDAETVTGNRRSETMVRW